MYKLGFEEAEETEIRLPSFVGSWRKQECSRKNIYFCFTDCAKAFDVWITTNWKILRWDTRPFYLPPEKPVCRPEFSSFIHGYVHAFIQQRVARCSLDATIMKYYMFVGRTSRQSL